VIKQLPNKGQDYNFPNVSDSNNKEAETEGNVLREMEVTWDGSGKISSSGRRRRGESISC
jgi:hypothetical protein